MVSVSASGPGGHEFHPGLCSYSVFAIICNEFAMQACCNLQCKSAANLLQTKIAIW
ncbi:hypothetical protein AVEN_35641-1, partial [Araneus ventricosus]